MTPNQPELLPDLTDHIEDLLNRIDEIARERDHYDYGLPCDVETRVKLHDAVRAWMNTRQSQGVPVEVVLLDIHGAPVREGDEVLLYAQNYASTLIKDGVPPIYEEDHTKPKPVADVPLVRGTVVWSVDMLAWGVRVSWTTPSWGNPPCWMRLGGGSYAVELIPPTPNDSGKEGGE